MNNNRKNTGYANRPFDTALPALLGKKQPIRRSKVPVYDELPKINNGEIDGKDHINVHHHAKSDLGKALSQYGEYQVLHPEYGSFNTVHGLICWLSNPNQPDSYRTLSGKDADAALKLVTDVNHLPDYGYQVLWATWYKIKSHAKLQVWVKDSTIKFEHYFLSRPVDPTKGGKKSENLMKQRNKSSWWMIPGMEELRKALKENREPNLDFVLPKAMLEKLQKQRKLESQKAAEKETDVVIDGNLRDTGAKVVKERTPAQIERRRAKNKAKREKRFQERGEQAVEVLKSAKPTDYVENAAPTGVDLSNTNPKDEPPVVSDDAERREAFGNPGRSVLMGRDPQGNEVEARDDLGNLPTFESAQVEEGTAERPKD